MANTTDLIDLIPQYPTAFSDPEATPPQPPQKPTEPDEEGRTGETPQATQKPIEMLVVDVCKTHLQIIQDDPGLLTIASDMLCQLALVAQMKRNHHMAELLRLDAPKTEQAIAPQLVEHLATEAVPPLILDLPETYARQGTPECPGGNCPLDGH